MFSDHLQKIDQAPRKTLLLVAAGLVIVCQLVAMALVAGEQVQKAQMRGDSDASRQAAVASCVEVSRGVAVKDCFSLGNPELESRGDTDNAGNYGSGGVSSRGGTLGNFAAPAALTTPNAAMTRFTSTSFITR